VELLRLLSEVAVLLLVEVAEIILVTVRGGGRDFGVTIGETR
jgi:hypothetical protein